MTTEPVGSQPKHINDFRIGDHAMLQGSPCKILELRKSKPGKHGSSKIVFVGRSLITGKQVRETGTRMMTWLPKPATGDVKTVGSINDTINPINNIDESRSTKKCLVAYVDITTKMVTLIDDQDVVYDGVNLPADPHLRSSIIDRWNKSNTSELFVQLSNDKIMALD